MDTLPRALHISDDDCPWVDSYMGFDLKVTHVDIAAGLWVVRNRFRPGVRIQTHRHTGPVYAFTLSGSWKYEEYPEVNRAGSYLFEPAGSTHTLIVPEDNTEDTDVWFAVWGCNLNLDADGEVESVYDARTIYDGYVALCEAQGLEARTLVVEAPD
jgi:quercetin dioxygenase-like cupin family protein